MHAQSPNKAMQDDMRAALLPPPNGMLAPNLPVATQLAKVLEGGAWASGAATAAVGSRAPPNHQHQLHARTIAVC